MSGFAGTDERVAWIAENLRIDDKLGRDVPLVPNKAQAQFWWLMREQERRGFGVRILVPKARQRGVSTASEGDIFARAQDESHKHGLVIAHDSDSTEKLFRMTRRFQDRLRPELQRETEYSTKQEIVYAEPHGSSIRVATAGGKGAVGRGGTYHYVHCSEVAFWPDQVKTLTAALACVPDEPGTMVVMESTANGVGDEFHDRCLEAVDRQRRYPGDFSGYVLLFLPWYEQAEYRSAIPSWYKWEGSEPADVEEDESSLLALGVNYEQLYWRRKTIREKSGGSVDNFHAEFPSTLDEAFVGSGRPIFSAQVVNHYRSTCRGYRKVLLRMDSGVTGGVRSEIGPEIREPCWHVWRSPSPGTDYVVAGDVAEGAVSDPGDESSEADWSASVVLDRQNLEQVAQYRGQIEADLFGQELLKVATWYNRAWVTPEANAVGQATLLVLRRANYSRILQRMSGTDSVTGKPLMSYGWKTTGANRDMMLDMLVQYMRPVEGSWEGQLDLHGEELVDELTWFVRTKGGRREHRSGKHDDLIFALGIALQLHFATSRTKGSMIGGRVDVSKYGLQRKGLPRIMQAAGYDDGLDMYDLDKWKRMQTG